MATWALSDVLLLFNPIVEFLINSFLALLFAMPLEATVKTDLLPTLTLHFSVFSFLDKLIAIKTWTPF
jgi:hypothetical protein